MARLTNAEIAVLIEEWRTNTIDKFACIKLLDALIDRFEKRYPAASLVEGLGSPSDDKLTVHDWLPLIRKAGGPRQLKVILEALDICWYEDRSILTAADWAIIHALLKQRRQDLPSRPS